MHPRPQSVSPPHTAAQTPLRQTWSLEHTRAQTPQFAGSVVVGTQAAPQRVVPAGHTHAPATQT